MAVWGVEDFNAFLALPLQTLRNRASEMTQCIFVAHATLNPSSVETLMLNSRLDSFGHMYEAAERNRADNFIIRHGEWDQFLSEDDVIRGGTAAAPATAAH
jgi:hypothetical protein